MEIQGQEVLSLQDALCCSTRESIRWHYCKTYALRANSFRRTYNNLKFSLVHEWQVSQETSLVISRLLRKISTRRSTSKSDTRKDCLLHYLRSPTKSTFKCLFKHPPLWGDVMSKSLRNLEDQDDRKKGTLSNQPWLMCVTPTALLGCRVLQPIEDVMSLGCLSFLAGPKSNKRMLKYANTMPATFYFYKFCTK